MVSHVLAIASTYSVAPNDACGTGTLTYSGASREYGILRMLNTKGTQGDSALDVLLSQRLQKPTMKGIYGPGSSTTTC